MFGGAISKLKLYGFCRFLHYSFLELREMFFYGLVKHSYSQNGEDLIIHKLLNNKKRGFYVDVGANDPTRFSNTKRFYLLGWKGINIEPNTDCFNKIVKNRSRDINLNLGVANKNNKIDFYQFSPDTLSTFSKKEASKYMGLGYKLVNKKKIKVEKLKNIFKKYLNNIKIDFLTIDTEGYEIEIIMSNDWNKFRPKVICVESAKHNLDGKIKQIDVDNILRRFGYQKYYDNGLNSIYQDGQL